VLTFKLRDDILEYRMNWLALSVLSYDQQLIFNIFEIFKIFIISYEHMRNCITLLVLSNVHAVEQMLPHVTDT